MNYKEGKGKTDEGKEKGQGEGKVNERHGAITCR